MSPVSTRMLRDGVGDGEHTGGPTVDRDEDGRLALGGEVRGDGVERGGVDPGVVKEAGGPDQEGVAVGRGTDALAGDRVEAGRGGRPDPAVTGARDS
ncbi:hypothetical protein AB0M38_11195 [Streptomyces sp. NPDC051742]|uniref:hypothetical protein n=1 Tax=unclassified Streptomyces TaxID=2593676 RepID=UPI003413D0AB